MTILSYIKYYLGFTSIIKTRDKYFVVKGLFMPYVLDTRPPHLWWYRLSYNKSFSFNTYDEALNTLNSLKIEVQ